LSRFERAYQINKVALEPTQEEIDNIELREDSVQDLMSRPPNWLLRSGTVLVFLVIAILALISWWVRYPDMISAPVTLTTADAPVDVVSNSPGNLRKLLVKDGAMVKAEQQLALLHSLADLDAVKSLQAELEALKGLDPDSLLQASFSTRQGLGELQNRYANFLQYLEDYQLFLSQQTALKQIPFLKKEINYYQALKIEMLQKDSILQAEMLLAEQKVKRLKEAKDIGGSTALEVEQAERELLQQARAERDLALEVLQQDIRINELDKQIKDIRRQTEDQAQGRFLLLKESYQGLLAEIEAWYNNYVLKAAVDGKIAYAQLWNERQYINAGTTVMRILPPQDKIVARVLLPIQGSGKVEKGQLVNIELAAFPRNEYGLLKAEVKEIGILPQENSLVVEVALQNGMQTNYKKDLPFRPNMQGRAEIITKPRRLIERLLESLWQGQ
jgi:multidrug efflux pump subunit AcrA (membrane-fusion protein)